MVGDKEKDRDLGDRDQNPKTNQSLDPDQAQTIVERRKEEEETRVKAVKIVEAGTKKTEDIVQEIRMRKGKRSTKGIKIDHLQVLVHDSISD